MNLKYVLTQLSILNYPIELLTNSKAEVTEILARYCTKKGGGRIIKLGCRILG